MAPSKSRIPRTRVYDLRSAMTRLRSGMRNKTNTPNASIPNTCKLKCNHKSRSIPKFSQRTRSHVYKVPQNLSPESGNKHYDGLPSSTDVKCAICLDTVDDKKMEFISCGHSFHKTCCANWLSRNNVCPMCRMEVPLQPQNAHSTIRQSHITHGHEVVAVFEMFNYSPDSVLIDVFGV